MPGFKLTFLPHQKSGVFRAGTTLRDAALELGILIDSTCAGIGTCGKCKVEVKSGASPVTNVERKVLSSMELEKGVRLSCQALLEDDAICTIPETSLAVIENIAIEGVTGHFDLDPDITKVALDLAKPKLGAPGFMVDAAIEKLKEKGYGDVVADLSAIRSLAKVTGDSWGRVTATIDDGRVLSFENGDTVDNLYGVAVDVGTTTLATKLVDLRKDTVLAVSTASNPQSALGADVVARIQYVVQHTGGLRKFSKLVAGRLNEMIGEMTREAGLRPKDISKIVIVGNTVMQHLLLGIDPRQLGVKPYTAACAGPVYAPASDAGLKAATHAVMYSAPNLSSYVGSDITAALVAMKIRDARAPTLVIDMGTNGEMVLTDGSRIACCSSPAGPAWEGACISWGMRASRGAIERFEILDDDVEFRTVGEASPVGICGSGLIDIICGLLERGILNASGRMLDGDRVTVLPDGTRGFIVTEVEEGSPILVSQADVRQIQLAKAGIATGIQALLAAFDLDASEIERVLLAGAFGNHLNGEDVNRIGLVPGVPADRIHFVGNAAISGAEAMLRSRSARLEAESIASGIEYIEIAAEAEFQDVFVDAIGFPENDK